MCALQTCVLLACTAGHLRSLAIRQLAGDRKYLLYFYMPGENWSWGVQWEQNAHQIVSPLAKVMNS